MQHARIIRRAWQVVWNNRALWLFGMLAALFTLNLSSSRQVGGWFVNIDAWKLFRWPWLPPSIYAPAVYRPAHLPPSSSLSWLSWLALGLRKATSLTFVGISVLFISLLARLFSLGALVGMVDDIEQRDRTSFSLGLKTGWRSLLRLLGVDVLLFAGLLALVIVFMLGITLIAFLGWLPWRLLSNPTLGGSAGAIGGLWSVFIVLLIGLLILAASIAVNAVFTMLRELAQREIVLRGRGPLAAIGAAARLFGQKTSQLGLMWLLLFAIKLAASLVTVPLMLAGSMAVAMPAALNDAGSLPKLPGMVLSFLLLAIIALAAVVINGVFLAFRSATWTLAYHEVAEPLAEPL